MDSGLRVSVIVPFYNAEKHLALCLESLLSQTYNDIEIVAVDDGSTDGSCESIRYLRDDPRIRLISQKNSGGPASPRNRGIHESSGDYVFLFDADDIAKPRKIESTLNVFNRSPTNYGLVASDFEVLDDSTGNVVVSSHLRRFDFFSERYSEGQQPRVWWLDRDEAFEQLIAGNFIGTSSVAMKREVLEQVGLFDTTLRNGDDYDMWLRIIRSTNLAVVGEVLHTYRVSGGSISSRSAIDLVPARLEVLERQKGFIRSRRQERVLRKRMASNFSALAWDAKRLKKPGLAIKSYWAAFLLDRSLVHCRGLVATMLSMLGLSGKGGQESSK